MASAVEDPIPTSAVLMASSRHISTGCRSENMAFIKCKKNDPNPEKCLEKGRDVTRCVLSLFLVLICKKMSQYVNQLETKDLFDNYVFFPFIWLKGLHQRCTKEMDAYANCMHYYTDEFDLCRKEQHEFEKACPLSQ